MNRVKIKTIEIKLKKKITTQLRESSSASVKFGTRPTDGANFRDWSIKCVELIKDGVYKEKQNLANLTRGADNKM